MDRLWQKVRKTDYCWEWTGGRYGSTPYGRIVRNGKRYSVHRYVYENLIGEIPDGMCVCHRCDNPPCVNPDHLFLGTHSDNMQDKLEKGRGNLMAGSKLSFDIAEEIRALREETGMTFKELGERYGVALNTCSRICQGVIWRDPDLG